MMQEEYRQIAEIDHEWKVPRRDSEPSKPKDNPREPLKYSLYGKGAFRKAETGEYIAYDHMQITRDGQPLIPVRVYGMPEKPTDPQTKLGSIMSLTEDGISPQFVVWDATQMQITPSPENHNEPLITCELPPQPRFSESARP